MIYLKVSQSNVVKIAPFEPAEEPPVKAQDIMTRAVVTVGPYTPVPDIAGMMVKKHISGMPVVTESGEIIGIVSQSDLLHRVETGTERESRRKWWFLNLADADAMAREYAKAHGLRARDVMSRYVISVRDHAELRDVADILDTHRIKRVPVLQAGRSRWHHHPR